MKQKGGKPSSPSKNPLLVFLAAFVALSSACIPLSDIRAAEDRKSFSIDAVTVKIGISPYVGFEITGATAGTNVAYNNSTNTFSRSFSNGEYLQNFGKNNITIYCNTASKITNTSSPAYQGGKNCKDNNWSLKAASSYVSSSKAAMKGNNSQYILSSSGTINGQSSNWAMLVSGVATKAGSSTYTPTVASGYNSLHAIPTTATEIAYGTTFPTIGGVKTFIATNQVSVQYGVSVANNLGSGSYTGIVAYTLSLK